jgi:putative sigma-54 modulation protein
MQINLQGKNLEVTEAIEDYVLKRVTNLEKLLSGIEKRQGEIIANFEVAKNTNHHKGERVFHADCLIRVDGREYYSSVDADDLYAAIDEVKQTLFNDIGKSKDRRQTLFKRGAASVKKMMKGLSKRNPFTSKY